jgi:AcrR family transcriptional regulator
MAKSLGIRKNPVKDEREQAFKQAALKVFSSKGYHNTTMAEIAMEAGFGKGTLYWYWKSKEELYFALVEESHSEFIGLVRKAAERDGGALEKLYWLGNEIVGLHYRHRDYTKLSWKMRAEELEAFSPEYVEKLHHNSNEIKEKLQEIISQGIEEGLLPQMDPYYLACMLLGLMEGMEIQWLEDPESFDLRTAMEMVVQLSGLFMQDTAEAAGKDIQAS